ncbi:MAG: SMP-30/gluconolactonase/LRE family protein [Candidatus Zixiibacteriota bacterium]
MSKKLILPVLVLVLLMPLVGVNGQLISPESVVFDSVHNRYLIADQSLGCIVAADSAGGLTAFNCLFPAYKGLLLRNDTLFCAASTTGLALFDLETGDLLTNIVFDDMTDLNDVIGDTSGNIYVSDAQGSKVHRLHLADMSSEIILDNFPWANGMVFDTANNRILICQWISHAPLVAINLDDLSVDTVRYDNMYLLDGLAWDQHGNLYVTSWGDGNVYVYKAGFTEPPVSIASGYDGPADIAFNYRDTVLAIPNTTGYRVDFLRLYDPDNDLIFNDDDNCPHDYNPGQEDSDSDGIGDVCMGCCIEQTGNVNCSIVDEPDITDITRLIDYLYLSHAPLCCPEEADCNGSGGEPDISDITALISYLYIDHLPLSSC